MPNVGKTGILKFCCNLFKRWTSWFIKIFSIGQMVTYWDC